MKRIDITKSEDGNHEFAVRENNAEEVLYEDGGHKTLVEVIEAIESLDLDDDYFIVASETQEAGESAVTALANEESVRTANYETDKGEDDNTDLTPSAHIETLG